MNMQFYYSGPWKEHPISELRRLEVSANVCEQEEAELQQLLQSLILSRRGEA